MSALTNLCQKCAVNLCSTWIGKSTLEWSALSAIQVRYRKPRSVPTAKSKIFFIPTKPEQDPEEYEELKIRYRQYRNDLDSIRSFLKQRYVTEEKRLTDINISADSHKEMIATMTTENESWNREVSKEREERQLQQAIKTDERLQKYKEYEERRRLRLVREAEMKVKRELELSKSYITFENLDEEVEKLLNSRVDYEFALDSQGRKLTGAESVIENKQETQDT